MQQSTLILGIRFNRWVVVFFRFDNVTAKLPLQLSFRVFECCEFFFNALVMLNITSILTLVDGLWGQLHQNNKICAHVCILDQSNLCLDIVMTVCIRKRVQRADFALSQQIALFIVRVKPALFDLYCVHLMQF